MDFTEQITVRYSFGFYLEDCDTTCEACAERWTTAEHGTPVIADYVLKDVLRKKRQWDRSCVKRPESSRATSTGRLERRLDARRRLPPGGAPGRNSTAEPSTVAGTDSVSVESSLVFEGVSLENATAYTEVFLDAVASVSGARKRDIEVSFDRSSLPGRVTMSYLVKDVDDPDAMLAALATMTPGDFEAAVAVAAAGHDDAPNLPVDVVSVGAPAVEGDEDSAVTEKSLEAQWLAGELSDDCDLVCPLKAPNLDGLSECRVDWTLYNSSCLVNGPSCPNCQKLRGSLSEISNTYYPEEDDRSNWDRAFVYDFFLLTTQNFRKDYTQNWKREKAVYFAFSIVSSVGYGDFSPQTTSGKWIVIIMAIPYIAIFAFALSQLAQVLISFLTRLLTAAHAKYETAISKIDHRRWSTLCEHVLEKTAGTMSENQFVDAAAHMRFGLSESALRTLYRQLDSDMSGTLDANELSTMMDVISNINAAKVVRMRAYWHILALLALLVSIILVGMVAYAYVEGWSYTNALYFIVVTLTTVGFGDYVPTTSSPQILLWLAHSVLGLGIATSFITSLQEIGMNRRKLERLSIELLKLQVVGKPVHEHDMIRKRLFRDMKRGREKLAHIVGADHMNARPIRPFVSIQAKAKILWGGVARASIGPDPAAQPPKGASTTPPSILTVVRESIRESSTNPAADRYYASNASPRPESNMGLELGDDVSEGGAIPGGGGGPAAPDQNERSGRGALLWDDFSSTWVDPDEPRIRFRPSRRPHPRFK